MTLSLADVAAESVLMAGGARAILLQVADPAVGRGVAEHSGFAEHPLSRLTATMTYLYAVILGDDADRAEVRRRVARAHRPVHGGPGPDGAPGYSAADPRLQLWVTATLYDTTTLVWDHVFGPLDAESADRVYAEYAAVGTTLRMRAEDWPEGRPAFDRYWNRRLDELVVTDAARGIARDLLFPRAAPWWLRSLMPQLRVVTAGLLPAEIARAYGLVLSPAGRRRFERWMHAAAAVTPRLPRRIRSAAPRHYLGRLHSDPGR